MNMVLEGKNKLKNIAQEILFENLNGYLEEHTISTSYIKPIKPFKIIFPDFSELIVKKTLRVVPGRRLVFLAEDNNAQQLILKLFVNKFKLLYDYESVTSKYSWLQEAGLKTPKIQKSGISQANGLAYVVSEYMASDASAETQTANYYKKIIQAIAILHINNLYQKDLHLNNFMLSRDDLYYLDTSSLEKHIYQDKRSHKVFYKNFSLFLAQLGIDNCDKWEEYLGYYLTIFMPSLSAQSVKYSKIKNHILKSAATQLNIRLINFVNKCQRESTDFINLALQELSCDDVRITGAAKREMYIDNIYDRQFFTDLLTDTDNFINTYQVKVLKNGNTAQVVLVNYKDKKIVIKRYLPGSTVNQFFSYIKNRFIKSRALSSWINANLLEHLGIMTPSPLGYAIKQEGMFVKDSVYVMEYIEDFERLDSILENDTITLDDKKQYLNKIITVIRAFNLLKLSHRDFKTVNLGFKNNKFCLLDLDAMKIYKSRLWYKRVACKDKIRIKRCLHHNKDLLDCFNWV